MTQPTGRAVLVESPSNPQVRMLRDLHAGTGRREHGAFLVEGVRLVSEAVDTGWEILVALYDHFRAESDPDLASLVGRIPAALPASPGAIKHASDTVTPQGIVAAARMPARLAGVKGGVPMVLVLDGVSDPGNAGTLLRSALGAGAHHVLALRGTVDLFSPKVVRAGMGAHFRLKLSTDLTWPEVTGALGSGRQLVVADATAGEPHYRFDWRRRAALIVGSEAHGPSAEAARAASAAVSIPLDPGLESLNAAIAGSIILFEAKRQRERGGEGA